MLETAYRARIDKDFQSKHEGLKLSRVQQVWEAVGNLILSMPPGIPTQRLPVVCVGEQ